MTKKWYVISLSLITLFLGLICSQTQGQVFIPYSFWQAKLGALTISDGATYDYGSIATNTDTDKIFTLSNTSPFPVSSITGASFSGSKYTFKGGSFPGTGGDCTGSLVGYGACTFVVTARSSTSGTFSDTVTVNYNNGYANTSTTRPVTATFTSTPTRLIWINTPVFIKVSTCVSVTVQAQDNSGNPISVASNTSVSLAINNASNANFYSNSGCSMTTTSQTITTGNNSVSFYFKSTTANQTGILVGSATGLIAATQNVNITNTPSKLLLIAPPRAKINTCNVLQIYTTDNNGQYSTVTSNTTVNLATTGSNVYYSDSGCTSTITSTTVTTGNYLQTVYTKDATIQTVTATITATGYTSSAESINFATSLTWWNTNWSKRIRIDINNLDQTSGFTNQPILVYLDSSFINYSDFLTNGADVRFVASDDTTQIDHEIELWTTAGTSQIWVRVPSITASASSDYIYMYYDNPGATDGQNKTGVWTNYWAVWHLNENPTGAAPQYKDSTVNARDGTAVNSPGRVTGVIGYAADLGGSTDSVQINQDLSPVIGKDSTFSCWMKSTQTGNNTSWMAPGITGVEQAGGGNDIFFGWIDGSGYIGVTAGNGSAAKSNFVISNNAWRHVTITRKSSTGAVSFYINGVLNNSGTSETGDKTTYFDLLGEIGDTGGTPENYIGQLDEVRVYNSIQSNDQIKADFKFMMNTNLIYNNTETWP